MSNHINFVGFSGNLGNDPQISQTSNGATKAVFSLANNREYRQDGEKKKQTNWFRCVYVRPNMEGLLPYLKKGKLVYVQGRMEAREYEKDGERRTIHEVFVNDLQLMSDGSPDRELAPVGAQTGKSSLFEDDDVPF